MADPEYYPLVELEIEEPELFGPEPQRYGFTTRPQSFSTVDGLGRVHQFGPGLIAADVPARRVDFYSGASAAEASPSITISLRAFDAVSYFARRIRFEMIRVRIWWWRPGWTLAEAVQVWTGRLADPVIDPDGGTFSATAPPGTTEIDVAFPPGFIGDEGRFPTAPQSSLSVAMPVILGTVRNIPAYPVDDDTADASPPAPAAPAVRYLIAGHRIPNQSLIARTDGDAGLLTGALAVQYARDGRGDLFSYVDIANTEPGWSPGQAVYVGAAVTAEVLGHSGPGDAAGSQVAIQGLGDVLLFMLHTYAREQFFEIDRDRIYGARSRLNAFRIGAWFNTRQQGESLLRILKSRFEGQFPVSFSFANGRFGWDCTAVPEEGGEAVAHIVWGQNSTQRSSLQPVSKSLLRTRFEVQYAADGFAAGTTASIRRDHTNSAPCRACLSRWHVNTENVVAAPDAADEYTARLLAEDQINRLTVMRSRIEYVVDEPRLATLPLLSRVVVTDATWGWVDEPFFVEGVALLQPGRVSLALITENGQ